MADAYKVKQDVAIPRAIREADEFADGTVVYETVGHNYPAGSYVLAEEISPDVRERVENGELDHLLEEVDREEAEEYRASEAYAGQYGTFVPEHSAEDTILNEYGHETVPRDEVLELQSAGADEAREALEAAKEDDADARPNLSAPFTPGPKDDEVAVPESDEPRDEDESEDERKAKSKRGQRSGAKSAQTTPSGEVGGEAKEAGEKSADNS